MDNQIVKTQNTLQKTQQQKSEGNLLPEKFIGNPEFPAVQNLVHSQGIETVLHQISAFAFDYLNLIEVGAKMNLSGTILTIKEMIIDFPDWSIEDFRYFFRGFAKGNFNTGKDKIWRLDMATIFDGARNYEIERTTAREKVIASKKAELNRVDPAGLGNPELENEIQALISNLAKPAKIEKEDPAVISKKQKRANYEAELIDYFNQNGLEFTEENFAEYRKINPFTD